ncbi:MAG: hypothetical protein ABGY71_06200 [bacterium]|nr:hypothetical protein [Planctomycetota bacterium]HIL51368.1 hypothetical protein [Planctomycetota bacterium]
MGICRGRISRQPAARLVWAGLALLAAGGCAGPGSEQHLAPLYTHISLAEGGVEHEALAGAVIARRETLAGPLSTWGLRPFFLHYPDREERSRTQFLYPFGRVVRGGGEFNWWLLPLADYRSENTPEGRKWSLLSLPGVYLASFPDGRSTQAWFPVAGRVEELMTWDRLDFALWPLWMRSVRDGRVTQHILFPFFSFTRAADGGGWRVWPLAGHTWVDDRYDRWWALWPILRYAQENLKSSPRHRQTQWSVFPLVSQARQGSYTSTTVLWPFFGYAHDPALGFWAWDGPWPLVRVMRPGDESLGPLPQNSSHARRTRFWPFWSHYKGDGLESTWYAWPLVNKRHESYYEAERDTFSIWPLWQSFDRREADGSRLVYSKLWPLYQAERETDSAGEELRRYLFPQLNPLWRWPDLDQHYSWIYELYRAEIGAQTSQERGLWGLWRREQGGGEERSYISGLWSRRAYHDGTEAVVEHSVFFGLLRWRSTPSDPLDFLAPALPGPGWPILRANAPPSP